MLVLYLGYRDHGAGVRVFPVLVEAELASESSKVNNRVLIEVHESLSTRIVGRGRQEGNHFRRQKLGVVVLHSLLEHLTLFNKIYGIQMLRKNLKLAFAQLHRKDFLAI